MEEQPKPPPRGRVPKRVRTNGELADLARRVGADWHPGDNVMTWIRRHEATTHELSLLVRDGWSWADLGRALDLAGIHYQTGRAIAGDLLRRKAGKARSDERKRQAGGKARHATVAGENAPIAIPAIDAPARGRAMPRRTETSFEALADDEGFVPEPLSFPLLQPKDGQPPPKPPPPTTPPREQSTAAKASDEEILRRVFGRP